MDNVSCNDRFRSNYWREKKVSPDLQAHWWQPFTIHTDITRWIYWLLLLQKKIKNKLVVRIVRTSQTGVYHCGSIKQVGQSFFFLFIIIMNVISNGQWATLVFLLLLLSKLQTNFHACIANILNNCERDSMF